jgi:pimeloyl-ACP methyl ester carboxylesterase
LLGRAVARRPLDAVGLRDTVVGVALVEVHCAEPTCRIATARNLVVYSWREVATLDQVRASGRISRAMARKHPRGTGSLHLIAGGIPRFSEEVRAEAAKIRGDANLSSLGVAQVVLVTGLAGVAARGFLSTVTLLARAARPDKVFSELRSAAAWLAPKLAAGGEAWTAAEVEVVAAEVTAGHG